ncbi:chorismate mutase [Marinovum sp.]|uniref:chorismate mutase n=1 Tax=Marinovum sp. TaxID=2024839 RepID=UPI002B27210C|nr:chorismate mutase [Marinovum sp.]
MRKTPDQIETMAELRAAIDEIDRALIALHVERVRYIDRAPALKAPTGIAARAPSRVADVLAKVRAEADATGFDADLAEAMWTLLIDAMIAREERVMGKEGTDG